MSNSSGVDEAQYMSKEERVIFAIFVIFPCVVCLFVNGLLLWTLLSKAILRETPRYCLLFNLLLSDTLHMSLSQMLYMLATSRTHLYFPVCALLTLITDVSNEVSPLTVVAMSLERYVAVCFPLHHATLLGGRRASVVAVLLWALCLLNLVVRVGLLMQFPFHTLDTLMMNDYCSSLVIRIAPLSTAYDQGYSAFLFVSSAVVILWSYVMVMMAARRCASEKSVKARNTLLLHLFQLVLSLSATIYLPLLVGLARLMALPRLTYVRIQNVLYVLLMTLPRALSVLIYGIKDQTMKSTMLAIIFCKKQ
ncbi:odorant receptor 131-2-like [Periophthalmus magnuspinnatus]|uniref:odorant receptor 131-2-like n=1 Tax=Periophthalmus magnuspinnatus TaxID=409849 RepID=UPI0024368C41|nr:odorant receptor 131-2-like [Periophthalmus magnuspinnatus]